MALIRIRFDSKRLKAVEEIFAEGTHQAEVLYALYALVIPDFSRMVRYNGWPKAGNSIAEHFCMQFRTFDRKHHPKVMAGGLWMNAGFSTLDNGQLDPWEVVVNTDEIEYETAPETI